MRTTRILICAILAAAALAVQAASAASPFATAMNNVCREADRKVAALGVSQSLAEMDANEPRLLAAARWKLAKLVALGKAPAGLTKAFARYVTLQRNIEASDAQMVTAAKKIHLSSVEQLQAQAELDQAKQDAPARKIGAVACLSTA
jgi:hypothetical protein